jgi:uncharacterized SAM-binding protein YcdF (DUF218 family)
MFLLKKIIAALALPPVSPLLLAALGLWVARRRPRFGHVLVALGIGALWLLATPWIANELLRSVEAGAPPTPEQLATTQAIVVLGGGSYRNAPEYDGDTVNELALERLRYGARLARTTGLPVAVTGGAPMGGRPEGDTMREALATDFGVAVRWAETESLDTSENAALLAPQLKQAGVDRIVLVTHAWHMRRAQLAFERQGFVVVPAPTRFAPPFRGTFFQWLPTGKALRNSQVALHEWLGLLAGRAMETLTLP